MAVYILQPKLLSFNHSFSSISQPVLSPLQQLHLYNSQYPRNDLPEQPFLILLLSKPFLQLSRLWSLFLVLRAEEEGLCKHFRHGNNQCCKEGILSLYHSRFHFKRQHLCMLIMVQLPRAELPVPGKQQAGSLEMARFLFSEEKAIFVLSNCTDLLLAITTLVLGRWISLSPCNSQEFDTSLFSRFIT